MRRFAFPLSAFKAFASWGAGLLALALLGCSAPPAATPLPAGSPTPDERPRPTREWNVEDVEIDGQTVRVLVRVFSTVGLAVTLDGAPGAEDASRLPILVYTFQGVEPGPHELEIKNEFGTYTQMTQIVVTDNTPEAPAASPTTLPGETAAPGPAAGEEVAVMPSRDHRPLGEPITGYSTTPPTSGPHWPQWRACGIYAEEIPDELIAHNLEHGNIVINHNLTNPAELARLRAAAEAAPQFAKWGIMRPYPALPPGSVVLTGWGVWDRMAGVDAPRIARFFAAYAGERSPEVIPCQ